LIRKTEVSARHVAGILQFVLFALACFAPSIAVAQSQQPPAVPGPDAAAGAADGQLAGSISGTVLDPSGASAAGVRVSLTREGQTGSQEVVTGDDGRFSFANVAPGAFHLAINSAGFEPQESTGTLHSGEMYTVPRTTLVLSASTTVVRVQPPPVEIAEDQIKDQEKQRVLGVIPNFYVTYAHHPVPLDTKQKFELAWRVSIDPITFVVNGAIAGVEQADDDFKGYGQGADGYGRRYGASYADLTAGTFLGDALFPSLFKQDPRYFYKGTGSVKSRILYAVANAVICKGDNGKWEVNYSALLGSLAAGGISNAYYPDKSRGAGLTFELAAVRIGANAAENLLQEFVIRKLTPSLSHYDPANP
jgi:Carboxypeptidase regulatory-like domain